MREKQRLIAPSRVKRKHFYEYKKLHEKEDKVCDRSPVIEKSSGRDVVEEDSGDQWGKGGNSQFLCLGRKWTVPCSPEFVPRVRTGLHLKDSFEPKSRGTNVPQHRHTSVLVRNILHVYGL